jgi:hypothetical protein
MSAVVKVGTRTVPGASFTIPASLTGDTSYPAGGYVFTAASFGFTRLHRMPFGGYFNTLAGAEGFETALVPTFASDGVSLLSFAWRLVVASTGVEVATGTSVATVGIQIEVEGS